MRSWAGTLVVAILTRRDPGDERSHLAVPRALIGDRGARRPAGVAVGGEGGGAAS